MKRNIVKAAILCLVAFAYQTATAQSDLGSILNNVLGGNSSSDNVISGLTSIFSSKKQASEKNIVGTWTYEEPAIVLKSENILTNAAAKVAASSLEKKLQTQLEKVGLKKGAMTLTFKSDGTFTETFGKKKYSGKWSIKDSKLNLIHNYRTTTLTTQIEGNQLMFVTDATKLLSFLKQIGSTSTNSTISTVTSLMKNVNGMQCGVTLVKKN